MKAKFKPGTMVEYTMPDCPTTYGTITEVIFHTEGHVYRIDADVVEEKQISAAYKKIVTPTGKKMLRKMTKKTTRSTESANVN